MKGSIKDVDFNIRKIKEGKTSNIYRVVIKVPMSMGWIDDMKFVVNGDNYWREFKLHHLTNMDDIIYFSEDVELGTKANYNYYFSFRANGGLYNFKKNNYTGDQNVMDGEKWKMSVNFDVPDWAKGKIMYHVFVDRFNRAGNEKLKPMPRRTIHKRWNEEQIIGPNEEGIWNADFYGGNLKGVEEKLEYIKSLGTSIIYLSPVVYSQSNHRYDTADYEQVDPYAGTNEDLRSLCNKAHKMGMKVILDSVFNHTGNDSRYFNEYNSFNEVGAFQSRDSKYYPFYRKYFSNNQTYFDYWWGFGNLPTCDGNSREWQEYIFGEGGVIDKWFALGIDGLRLDVADELSDYFIEGIRKAVKRNKEDGFILGEVWENPMRMNRGYLSSGKGMDSVMDYPLVDALIRYYKYCDVDKLRRVLYEIKNEYPDATIQSLMNFTSTHDISRGINLFATYDFKQYEHWAWEPSSDNREWQKNFVLSKEDYERGKAIYKSYIYSLAFLPGNLSIFYGDEMGLEGMGNLSNRKPFPKEVKDKELLEYFRSIGRMRNHEQFLEKADLEIYDINSDLLMFRRINGNQDALITVNRTGEVKKTPIPSEYQRSSALYSLNNSTVKDINPYGGLVLKKTR